MGIGGISIWQLLIILIIVVLIFGTKKLKNMGGDLGSAIKNFKESMNSNEKTDETEQQQEIEQNSASSSDNQDQDAKIDQSTNKEDTKL